MMPAAQPPVAVAHVVQNLAIGGLERVVVNLASHAHRDRYRPFIVCLGPGGPLVEQARGRRRRVRAGQETRLHTGYGGDVGATLS